MTRLTPLTACLVFIASDALQAATAGAESIEFAEKTLLEKDHLRHRLEWVEKNILPAARLDWKGKGWEQIAKDFSPKVISVWIEGNRAQTTYAELAQQAHTLMSRGCDESFLCFLCHLCIDGGESNWRDSLTPLRLSLIKQKSASRPAAVGCWGLVQELKWFHERNLSSDERQKELIEWMIKATSDQSYSDEFASIFVRDQMAWLNTLKDQPEEAFARLIETWQASRWPDWVKLTLTGAAEIKWAWILRGSGTASTVAMDGWKGFYERLLNARKALEQAWKLRPDRPEAAALMITVTMGQSLPITASRQWFDRSVTAQFDYLAAYYNLLWHYAPRWGGSEQLVLEFGKACAETKRYDTFVPTMLYQACRTIAKESNNPLGTFSHAFISEAIVLTTQGYLQQKTESVPWNKNLAAMSAVSAWLASEPQIAASHLNTQGSTPFGNNTLGMMSDLLMHEQGLRLSIAAATSALGPLVQKIETFLHKRKFPEARAALESIDVSAIPAGSATRNYLVEKKSLVELAVNLAQGGWHPIPIHPGLTNFKADSSSWTVSSDGELVLLGTDAEYANLLLNLPMPEDIQIRGEFVHEAAAVDGFDLSWAVGPTLNWQILNIGYEPTPARVRGMLSDMKERGTQAFITADNLGGRSVKQPIKLLRVNTFDLCFKQGQATLIANSETTVTLNEFASPLLKNKQGLVGIAANRIASGAKVTVRNLAVRIPE